MIKFQAILTKKKFTISAQRFPYFAKSLYSQRKKQVERAVQSTPTPSITQTGNRTLVASIPRNVFFIIVIPCVSGKKFTTVRIAISR